jgi:hypothetical protein
MRCVFLALTFVCASTALAEKQKFDVKIVNRQDNQTDYTYVVPSRFNSTANSNVNCNGSLDSVNCTGSTTTTGSASPAHEVSYHVRGATFTLLLPDGRAAVVNCESKFAEHMAGAAGNHRSCRVPLVDSIQAEFNGDKAKLMWVVSLDGKKTQSETYTVLAVLDKPREAP